MALRTEDGLEPRAWYVPPIGPARVLLRDRFPVAEQIRTLTVPTVVVYGSADAVVPAERSRVIAEASPGLLRIVRGDGEDHNDAVLLDGHEVISSVRELVTRLDV